MSEDEPGQPWRQDAGDPRLVYRNPVDDGTDSRLPEMLVAAAVTAITWIAAVFVLIYFAFAIDYRGMGPSGVTGAYVAVACGVVLFAMMVFIAIRWYRQPAMRHRAIGIWIGAGVACLIEGICFAGMTWK